MSKKTIYLCDIKDCGEPKFRDIETAVIYTTEQTEGRSINPYLETSILDLCETHDQQLLESSPLIATGAQGYNDIVFRDQS